MILVVGRSGQLARALAGLGGAGVRCVGRPDLDFDRPEGIGAVLDAAAPDLVVNAAAWTAVDAAETEQEAAWRGNCLGPAQLAAWCAAAGVPFIHVSTDYVFDGLKNAPYVETDPTNPMGVYGASKLAGEQAVLAAQPRSVILRTAWVYDTTGKNFLRTMLGAAERTNLLRVVADQVGCPTNATDLAQAVLAVAAHLQAGWQDQYGGVFHAAGAGETSWHGFAEAIFTEAERYGRVSPEVVPIRTEDWPTPARRPPNSRLDCQKLDAVFGIQMPPWPQSLTRSIDNLLK